MPNSIILILVVFASNDIYSQSYFYKSFNVSFGRYVGEDVVVHMRTSLDSRYPHNLNYPFWDASWSVDSDDLEFYGYQSDGGWVECYVVGETIQTNRTIRIEFDPGEMPNKFFFTFYSSDWEAIPDFD